MSFAVTYGPNLQNTSFFSDPEDAYDFALIVDGVCSELDDEPIPIEAYSEDGAVPF